MSKKGDARVKLRLAKALKQKERTARQASDLAPKAARSQYAKEAPKQIRLGANPDSVFQMKMRWTDEHADKDGEWTWGVARDWGEEVWNAELQPKLNQFAALTWAEIERQNYGNEGKRHRAHHTMNTCDVCDEAQSRLHDLVRAYPDILFRFRLGNLPRLWGVRIVDQFEVLWYDPTHQIYPLT